MSVHKGKKLAPVNFSIKKKNSMNSPLVPVLKSKMIPDIKEFRKNGMQFKRKLEQTSRVSM